MSRLTLQALTRTAAAVLAGSALMASAHTPYLLPTTFDAQPKAVIGVDASFTEKFFIPEVAFGATAFMVTAPDGSRIPFEAVHQFRLRTSAEQKLPDQKGTYRLSTGARLGAIFRAWKRDGKVEVSRDPNQAMPADAEMVHHYQSLSVSEAYVTAGAPNTTALAPTGKGLEIVAITHPSDLFVGEKFEFTVQIDGKPLPKQKIDIYRSPMDLSSQHQAQSLETDAAGRASMPLAKSGIYLALVRHRAPAPQGAAAPMYGHNYTLTFRVLDQ